MLLTARYVLPISSDYIEDGAVLVRDDKIVEVGPASDLLARYPEEETRDFGMAAIMPGLVNCHSHLEYSIMRGILNDDPYVAWKTFITEKESLLTEDDWINSAILGAYESASGGITTIADVTATGASLIAGERMGLRGIIYREVGAPSRDQVTPAMEEAVAQIEDWQAHLTTDRFRIGIGPDSLYTCHPLILKEIARYAIDEDVPVAIHMAGSHEESDFIRYGSSPFSIASDSETHRAYESSQSVELLPAGCSPVQYALNWDILFAPEVLAVHCVKVDDLDIRTLAENHVNVCVCPRANAKLGMGVAPVIKMQRAGIAVGLGTDSPAAADSIDLIEEMRFTMLILRAINGKDGFIQGPDMIRMATLDSARALGIDDIVGSLDPGKHADIIAVDLSDSRQAPTHFPTSAIVHTADRDNIKMTMVDGNIIYDADAVDTQKLSRVMDSVEDMRVRLRA